MKGRKIFGRRAIGILLAFAFSGSICLTQAQTNLYLNSGNSSVVIDPTGAGVTTWTVDGLNQLTQHWYWWRIGTNGRNR